MPASATLHPLTLHFRDDSQETCFRTAEDGNSLKNLRIGLLAGVLLFAFNSVLIGLLAPAVVLGGLTMGTVMAALATVAAISLAFYALTFTPPFVAHPQWAPAAVLAMAAVPVAMGLRALPGEFVAARGFMFLVFHLFTIYSLVRLRMLPACAAGWGALVLYVVTVRTWGVMDENTLARHLFWLIGCNVWGMLICWQMDRALRREFAASLQRDQEHARAEGLLLNILPAAIAEQLKASPQRIAEHREEVTVLFADIVGFTPLSERKTPAELVDLLDRLFTRFDAIAAAHGLEKIKTIGDAYMAVAGLPQAQADHAERAARAGLEMVACLLEAGGSPGDPLQLRVGLHTGPVVAGVIGRSKFSYDLWGDTVNTASRLESAGVVGAVHCSAATAGRIRGAFALAPRGQVELKGKGAMETFLVGDPVSPISP